MRPVLKPGLRPVWRDAATVQLGLGPQRQVVLHEVRSGALAVLDDLTGRRTLERLRSSSPPAAAAALDVLTAAGLLADASAYQQLANTLPPRELARLEPDLAALSLRHAGPTIAPELLAARRRSWVAVCGGGRVGSLTAALLAAAGVGRVTVTDPEPARPGDTVPGGLRHDDVGRPRGQGASSAVRRVRPSRTARGTGAHPGLVVLAPAGLPLPDPDVHRPLRDGGTPHLLAGVRETAGVVGPLVLPGQTSCLDCMELTRADRDPGWRMVAATLLDARRRHPEAVEAGEVGLAAVVAGLTTMQAVEFLDRETLSRTGQQDPPLPPTAAATLEVDPPDWRLRRRRWPVHPACPCAATRTR